MPIPKIIHQVWVGPLDPPRRWMATWRELNPQWEYRMWGNDEVFGRKWRNQPMIDEYVRRYREEVEGRGEDGRDAYVSAQGATFRGEKAALFAWHVISDIVRYEILLEQGGFMPGADHECLAPVPDAFLDGCSIYTEWTGRPLLQPQADLFLKLRQGRLTERLDLVRFSRYDPYHCSPVIAAEKGHPFLEECVRGLEAVAPGEMGEAVDTTGNVFMARTVRKFPHLLAGMRMPDYDDEQDPAAALAKGMFMVHRNGTTRNRYGLGR